MAEDKVAVDDGDSDSSFSGNDHDATSEKTDTLRSKIGRITTRFSDFVNENLIVARYTTTATVFMLAGYGLSQSPLMFRYRSVSDIPSKIFTFRRRLRCRLVNVVPSATTTETTVSTSPILCQVRHLSPLESVLPVTWYQQWVRMQPAALSSSLFPTSGQNPDESSRDLWTIQIAGTNALVNDDRNQQQLSWLRQLAKQRMKVSCQLLARHRQGERLDDKSYAQSTPRTRRKRSLREVNQQQSNLSTDDEWSHEEFSEAVSGEGSGAFEEVAIVKLYYCPTFWHNFWFPVDVGLHLVQTGQALASDDLYGGEIFGRKKGKSNEKVNTSVVVDASSRFVKRDIAYMSALSQAEFEAAKGMHGLWRHRQQSRQLPEDKLHVLDEVDFQSTAKWWQKIARWMRGG